MKKNIHPEYHHTKVICACGNTFVIGSVLSETIKVEVCSACHPFYTGKQKLIDTAGRVDKFKKRSQMAKTMKEKTSIAVPLAPQAEEIVPEPPVSISPEQTKETVISTKRVKEKGKKTDLPTKKKPTPHAKRNVKVAEKTILARIPIQKTALKKKITRSAGKDTSRNKKNLPRKSPSSPRKR